MNRKPNAGPYIVSWLEQDRYNVYTPCEIELHLWADVCKKMRELLIQNAKNISVQFC